jgi:hypothetical protein
VLENWEDSNRSADLKFVVQYWQVGAVELVCLYENGLG